MTLRKETEYVVDWELYFILSGEQVKNLGFCEKANVYFNNLKKFFDLFNCLRLLSVLCRSPTWADDADSG